jgi:hypothetical protein
MRSSIARKERLLLDEHTCCNCKSEATQVHHIVPLILGGNDTLGNLVSLCDGCHAKVHGKKACDHVALTKAGLQRARERGVRLGGTGGAHASLAGMNEARRRKAREHKATVKPLVTHLRQQGMTLQGIAETLNASGAKTAQGCEWRATQVMRVLAG